MQTFIAFVLLASAVGFMLWKFLGTRLTDPGKQQADNCGPDCKCG